MENYGIFYLLIFIIFIVSLFSVFKFSPKVTVLPIGAILVLITTFFKFGNDTTAYIELYDSVPRLLDFNSFYNYILTSRYEQGFLILAGVLRTLDLNYFFFFAAISSLSIFVLLHSFLNVDKLFFFALIWYIGTFYLWNEHVQIRQGVATSIFMLSLSFLAKRDFFRVFECFLLAIFFHYAAAISLIYYMCSRLLERRNLVIGGLLFSCLFSLLIGGKELVRFLSNFGIVPTMVVDYLTYSAYSFKIGIFTLLKGIIFSILILLFWEDFKKNGIFFEFCKVYILGIMMQVLFYDFYILGIRLAQVFLITECVVGAGVFNRIFKKYSIIPVVIYSALSLQRIFFN